MSDILVDMFCVAVAAGEGASVLALLQERLERAEAAKDNAFSATSMRAALCSKLELRFQRGFGF